jgi:hypothetical protein
MRQDPATQKGRSFPLAESRHRAPRCRHPMHERIPPSLHRLVQNRLLWLSPQPLAFAAPHKGSVPRSLAQLPKFVLHRHLEANGALDADGPDPTLLAAP